MIANPTSTRTINGIDLQACTKENPITPSRSKLFHSTSNTKKLKKKKNSLSRRIGLDGFHNNLCVTTCKDAVVAAGAVHQFLPTLATFYLLWWEIRAADVTWPR